MVYRTLFGIITEFDGFVKPLYYAIKTGQPLRLTGLTAPNLRPAPTPDQSGRATRGSPLINPSEGDTVASVARSME